jgi:hypothetical protein
MIARTHKLSWTRGYQPRLALALLLATQAFAAVDGIVVNGTTGKPQAGSTVTLYQTTQQGPQNLGSVKTDATGKFVFTQDVQAGRGGGPLLLQAVFDGVQYNKTLPPGFPTSGVNIPVFASTKAQGDAKIEQHFLVIEPNPNGNLQVTEGYIYKNEGKTTWNDPDRGELQFELPAAAQDKVEVNVTAPGGLPIRRAPDPLGGKPHQFKVDFPIKPGQSRMELTWTMPFNSPGVFEEKILSRGGMLRVVAPVGVEFKGDDVKVLGQEPSSKATIYGVKGPDIKFVVQGTGLFNQPDNSGGGSNNGQNISENLPKLYGMLSANSSLGQSVGAVKWILATVLGMLALGFVLLYRKGNPIEANPIEKGNSTKAANTHARGRG